MPTKNSNLMNKTRERTILATIPHAQKLTYASATYRIIKLGRKSCHLESQRLKHSMKKFKNQNRKYST